MTEQTFDLTDPSVFTRWAEDTIRFGDMDSTGHVNNVSIARYVETGRVIFMRRGFLPDYDERSRFIVANLTIRYRAQAFWPGDVRIGCRVVKVGRTSFTLGNGVFVDQTCIATAETVMVSIFDNVSTPIADPVRDLLVEAMNGKA